jgi:3-(3-hydroxy-phenyl)propionate hydroxylase
MESQAMKTVTTSVLICGAGPAGLTLAHLLGREGVAVVLLEKLDATVREPRAISIDGESLRTLQHAGVVDGFADELLSGITADYVNGEGRHLFSLGGDAERPFGYPTINSFDQPALDAYLAAGLAGCEEVEVRFGHTLERFEQSSDGVTALVTDGSGESLEIRAAYLVGCDGGRSTIRSLLGIEMEGDSNPLPWLVIDTVDPHLDNEMDCCFFCDTARPGMTIRKRHAERRWEWMLMPGEEPEALLDDAAIRRIIAPYTDAEQVNIYRKRVYNFHAIIANRWQQGRVFLAGDAAHMTPPFAGQGLNSGLRDVRNLAWKLAGVVRGDFSPAILSSYELERAGHARELIDTALALGAQIQPIDPAQAAERDAFFAALDADPAAMADFQQALLQPIRERRIDQGLIVEGDNESIAGRLLIQPRMNAPDRHDVLLDELLAPGFTIVGYDCDPGAEIDAGELAWWLQRATGLLPLAPRGTPASGAWVEDARGDIAAWLGDSAPRLLLVRPDRFCMAAFEPADATATLGRARALLERNASSND